MTSRDAMWRFFLIFFSKCAEKCWKSADVSKSHARWVHKVLFFIKNYLIATKWVANQFDTINDSKVTAILVKRRNFSQKVVTSLLKSADISKIMTSYDIFLYFLEVLLLLGNRGKFHPFPIIFEDFRQGGYFYPPHVMHDQQKAHVN